MILRKVPTFLHYSYYSDPLILPLSPESHLVGVDGLLAFYPLFFLGSRMLRFHPGWIWRFTPVDRLILASLARSNLSLG